MSKARKEVNAHTGAWHISADDFPDSASASDQIEFMLGYSILAPSPLNTQPWLFKLGNKDVEICADSRRKLAALDSDGRELIISCGAALLNLKVAAEYFGFHYHVDIEPEPDNPDILARFTLGLHGETSSEDILVFNAITQRRSCRRAFEDTPVPDEFMALLSEEAARHGAWLKTIAEPDAREAVAKLVGEADKLQWADKQFRDDLAAWSRAHPLDCADGFGIESLGIKSWMSFAGSTLIRTFDMGNGQAATDMEIVRHSPLLAVIGTDADDVGSWLNAGQAMQHVLLRACSENIQASFLNQAIEVAEKRQQLAALVGVEGCPQILMRMGYGAAAPLTPRRPVKSVLISWSGGT